jgi:dynein light chain roadblock-type
MLYIASVKLVGLPIRSTFEKQDTAKYCALIKQLTGKGNDVIQNLDTSSTLTFLRVRTEKYEIHISPEKEYVLMVIQDITDIKYDDQQPC